MIYIYSFITSLIIITAQILWKKASSSGGPIELSNINKDLLIDLFFSTYFIVGTLLYVVGVFLFVWLLSKYQFSTVQITITSLTIVLGLIVAGVIFKEEINILDMVGVILIVLGIFLVNK